MAASIIRIKRSSVSGKIPSANDVPLGELALNTYDGKLYASKNVGIGTTVFAVNPWSVGLGSNTYNTFFTAGSVGIGTTDPTRTLDVNGDIRLRGGLYVGAANTSGTFRQVLQSTGLGVTWSSNGIIGIGTEFPSSALNGDLFYSAEYAKLFVYYDEDVLGIGTDAFWVDAAPFNVGVITSTHISFVPGSATLPSMFFVGDSQTGFFSPASGQLTIVSTGASVLNVNPSGIRVTGVSTFTNDVTITDKIIHSGDTNTAIRFPAADTFTVETAGSERLRITSAGLVGIGTTAPQHLCQIAGTLAIDSFNDTTKTITLRPGFEANANGGIGLAAKDHSGDAPDGLGIYGTDGVSVHTANAGTFFERMRIDSGGNILIGQSTTTTPGIGNNTVGICLDDAGTGFFSRAAVGLRVNRTADGAVVAFASAGTEEGNISISGSTVSYNGAHLSRWSQLSNNAERIEILRGSVLSNIDEMCEWGEEDNEQLNRMKVSDVEGDKNVSGVFQDWDDDDETYTDDFYCAMTGDFIIRIAEGVTVERGDLLMSAGDGTAKPQDDDIIRSKTIAKVTSTNVSCTYADGSYCVPCVLMAC
jgi:hypothetical protein